MTDLPVPDPFDDRLITDGCCKEERTSSNEVVGDEIEIKTHKWNFLVTFLLVAIETSQISGLKAGKLGLRISQ